MPPNGPDEWRARIGHWENRKLRWYQAHCGSRPRVPLHLHLERVISELLLLCVLLLLSLVGKVGTGVCVAGNGTLSSLGKLSRCYACGRRGRMWATPLLSLFLALSLLLVVAGDVETNPGPISDELLAQVDDSVLSEEDTYDVYSEVVGLAGRWSNMCLALRLLPSDRNKIAVAHPGNPDECLEAVIVKWLQKCYNYQKFGSPTWKMLVKAVGNPVGGNNTSLAETIAKNHPGIITEETTAETAEPEEVMISDDEEWDPSFEFADMLTTVTELLDHSANMKQLKLFLKFLCHPRTRKCYIDIRLYDRCNTPGEIIEALHPQYINFMHTHLLRRIVNKFGDEQSRLLLKQYEDRFPRKNPLKWMGDPLSDEEIESFTGTKRMEVVYSGATVDTSTMEDVERVRKPITRSTGIDESVTPFANQKRYSSVIFTFLIPKTVVSSAFSNLDEDDWRDLADHDILRIEVDELIIDLQSFQTVAMPNASRTQTKTDTFHTEAKNGTSQVETTTDKSQEETKTDISAYTASGMKRVSLICDSPKRNHYNSKFQELIYEVGTSLAESVEVSKLKDFLQSFTHILYPETQYIDPTLLKDTESITQMFTALQPQILNFLNWGVLWKAIDAFHIKVMPAFQSYTDGFPPHTKLSTLPDPMSEEGVSGFKGFQKLRVTCGGGSRIEWTLGDVQVVREAMEKATGIDENFIIYAYWEGGFTTHQFTFLIPKCISGIFWELCEEDLIILAKIGVQRLEVDYVIVVDNIQEHYKELPQAVTPAIREGNRTRTKNFGLQCFIPEDVAEQMSGKNFSYLNDLITSTPVGKLQEVCSNDFLKVFAKKMCSWNDLAPYLGINQWDLEDLAEWYPGDEDKQKYVALLNWKSIDVNSATYERLVECLLTHGHIDDAERLLLHFQGDEVQKAQEILRQRFLKDSFSKRKLWFGAPKLPKFNRRLGIVQNAPLLSELDYTSCHEMMDQFPSEIQELSMKSVMNKIGQKKSRVFIFKGPPGCGKTELISRLCRYWAKHYALRQFSLVLYVNIWDFHKGCTLWYLIEKQLGSSTVSSEKICQWIKEEKGNEVLFVLDGFCHKYLYRSPLKQVDLFSNILSGHSNFSNSTVVISTTCSDFVVPLCENFTQFEILGLSDEQVGKQVIQHFDSERAFNFLSFLAGNPEIKGLDASPSYLLGIMYIFGRIPYNDLPVTWTQLYTSLVVLVSEWHKGKLSEKLGTDSLQSQFKNILLENSKRIVEESGDLPATISKSLIHDVEEFDYVLPDHNSTVPYLQSFMFSLETLFNLDYIKLDKTLKDVDANFWNFLAGLEVETHGMQLLKQHYQGKVLKMTNCLSESRYVTAEQQANLSSLTAKVPQTVVTTRDIHSLLHCLPYMQDPHTVVLDKCLLGTQAAREFSRFLAANSWTDDHCGIKHLHLSGISYEAVSTIAVALKTNLSIQTLNLTGISDEAISSIGVALNTNHSLQTLSLGGNRIEDSQTTALADALSMNQSLTMLNLVKNGIGHSGATALAGALRVNQSLTTLNLGGNEIGESGATVLADALKVNQSLTTLDLEWNGIGESGATTLADALRVNQSLTTLDLEWNGIGESGATALADALRVNQSLTTLNLELNRIEVFGATALADALRVNKSLTTLNLGRVIFISERTKQLLRNNKRIFIW